MIRRKRQALPVGALVLCRALLAGVSVYLLQKRASERPTARRDYALVSVAALQPQFNRSLSAFTVQSINGGSKTPQATAYRWLFASDNHPDLPQAEAVERMVRRFAPATVYYSTGGNGTWRTDTHWLDKEQHEVPVVRRRLGTLTRLKSLDLSVASLSGPIPTELCSIATMTILRLNDNGLNATIPAELGLLSGTIPTHIGGLTRLEDARLSSNRLTGTLSSERARAPDAPRHVAAGREPFDRDDPRGARHAESSGGA
jgi:hypothetical protein